LRFGSANNPSLKYEFLSAIFATEWKKAREASNFRFSFLTKHEGAHEEKHALGSIMLLSVKGELASQSR